jgi:hypothetical protein
MSANSGIDFRWLGSNRTSSGKAVAATLPN